MISKIDNLMERFHHEYIEFVLIYRVNHYAFPNNMLK